MLEKELCKEFGVDEFQEYVVNSMEAIEDTLRLTKTMPEYYSRINEMLKSDYQFLKNVRDFYAGFLKQKQLNKSDDIDNTTNSVKEVKKDYYQCIYDVMKAREEFLKRNGIV